MAKEISLDHDASGLASGVIYAIVRNTSSLRWQVTTNTFVVYNGANRANYIIPLTEEGASRVYTADFPAMPPGLYSFAIYLRAGGSPAETDTLIGGGSLDWDDARIISLAQNEINALAQLRRSEQIQAQVNQA